MRDSTSYDAYGPGAEQTPGWLTPNTVNETRDAARYVEAHWPDDARFFLDMLGLGSPIPATTRR